MSEKIEALVRQLGVKYENKLREFVKEIEEDEKNLIAFSRREGGINLVGTNLIRRFKTDVGNTIPKLIYMKNLRGKEEWN